MPPKKKSKATHTPGIARDHLTKTFSAFDTTSAEQLLNGHVLFLLLENDLSHTKTEKVIRERFSEQELQSVPLKSRIKNLEQVTLNKFRKLTDEREFRKFDEICRRLFSVACSAHRRTVSQPLVPLGSSPTTVNVLPTPVDDPLPGSSNSTTNKKSECAKCGVLRIRLKRAIQLRKESHQKHFETTDFLRTLHRKKQAVRVLNQNIKRKQAKINELKRKESLNNLKTKHRKQMKKVNRKLQTLEKKYETLTESVQTASNLADTELLDIIEAVRAKDAEIVQLENCSLELEERVESMSRPIHFQKEGKMYSKSTRLFVFDAVVNQVPTGNIPKLLEKFVQRTGAKLDVVPHRNTVEMMVRELGVIAQLQTAEAIMDCTNSTLGFDASTQEGVHVNSIHITFENSCLVIAVDQLPGGTADDYSGHVISSIDDLALVYSSFHGVDYKECRSKLIANISNTMTDRVASNHAAIRLVNEAWDKTLTELNCHLHPLDTVASATRSSLKLMEPAKGKLFGADCMAANIILQMNKVRYKDGKGDPQGFKTFLDDNKLGKGFIPRYRGNRLHVVFHIAGKYFVHHSLFESFLESGTQLGGLRSSLLADFKDPIAKLELQVLGLVGKLYSGPWMKTFYTSAEKEVNHVEGIQIVRNVLEKIKQQEKDPIGVLSTKIDFFGNLLEDSLLSSLQQEPSDTEVFEKMMKGCLGAIVTVLERQYDRYFKIDVTEELKKQTASARSHNIDAEEIMGMFSAAQQKAPNATLCYLSSKMRAQKNNAVGYLDSLDDEKKERVMKFAVPFARKSRERKRQKQKDITAELSKRTLLKREKKNMIALKKIETKLKTIDISELENDFPDLERGVLDDLTDLLQGKVVARNICHVWFDTDTKDKEVYNGRIKSIRKKKNCINYCVAYWDESSSFDNAEDYDMSKYALGADLVTGDLIFC